MSDVIYFDNNATTQVAPEVLEAMLPFFKDMYGNASSMHSFGGQVGKYIATAREQIADLLGALPDEIMFTSCGTESDNTAVISAIETQPEKKHFITTRVEHSAMLAMGDYLEKKGYEVTYISVDSKGQLDLAELEVVLFHADAVQAVGKEIIDLQKLPIDFLALSGHKLHAPKGIGVLYIRRGTRFRPFLRGGHQERGRRAGTENAPYIIGLGKACELAGSNILKERTEVARLRDMLEQGILAKIDHAIVNGDREHRLPNTTSIAFEAVEGEAILLMLDQFGICASSGSACTSGSLEPSHVLRAMGVPFNYAHGSIRFSLSRYSTEEEVKKVIEVTPKIIENLRAISPFRGKSF